MRGIAAAAAVVVLLANGCSGDDDPAADVTTPPPVPRWNPCDSLDVAEVSGWFGGGYSEDSGTPEALACTFTPDAKGGPVIDANYQLFEPGLDALFDAMALDPDDVTTVKVRGADAAKVVVDFDESQLLVSGFVQNDGLIQTVDVIDPAPYDKTRVVRGVRSILAEFSAAAES